VAGLRREEVTSLAGVSVDYYKGLERGTLTGVSEMVLEALAGALQLDDAERAHLFNLARAANPAGRALYAPLYESPEQLANSARFTFLDPAATVVGELELSYETMELTGDPGLVMSVYSPEPGTKSEESLRILASWSAVDQAQEASVDATAVATEVLADPD
jgi:transcriptional regulator with XRE-family HTH domain